DFEALSTVDARLGKLLGATTKLEVLKQNWEFLKARSRELRPADSDDIYGDLIGEVRSLISHVGDTSNLILDPDLDTYYLMDSVLLKLPEGADYLAQARLDGEQIVLRQGLTPDERARFTVLAGLIRTNMDAMSAGLEVAFRSTVDPQLDSNLRGYL